MANKIPSLTQWQDLVSKIKTAQDTATAAESAVEQVFVSSGSDHYLWYDAYGNNDTLEMWLPTNPTTYGVKFYSNNQGTTAELPTVTIMNTAIANAVGGITSFEYQVVQALPATGVKGTIYLVPNSGTNPNIYDEYIWIEGTPGSFEKIGTTEIDLSNYYTKTESDTLLAAKADATDIPTVNNATLTIQKNGTSVATFTANSATNATANITVPTSVSELTNDSGFLTTIPVASNSTLGGIKVGSGLSIDGNGVLTATGTSMVLYSTTGQNTDGAMTQKAVTDNLPVEFTTAEWNALWA